MCVFFLIIYTDTPRPYVPLFSNTTKLICNAAFSISLLSILALITNSMHAPVNIALSFPRCNTLVRKSTSNNLTFFVHLLIIASLSRFPPFVKQSTSKYSITETKRDIKKLKTAAAYLNCSHRFLGIKFNIVYLVLDIRLSQ